MFKSNGRISLFLLRIEPSGEREVPEERPSHFHAGEKFLLNHSSWNIPP